MKKNFKFKISYFYYYNINNLINTQDNNYNQNSNQPLNVKDDEYQGSNNVHHMMRLGFIRKVYGIICFQLMITVLLCGLTFISSVKTFYLNNVAIFWVCLGLSIVIVIPLICCKKVARTVPTNYILLTLWTICEAYMVATCCCFYDEKVVLCAASMTLAVTVAITAYACTTKTDFTFLGALLFMAVCLMFCLGIACIWVRFLHTLYCVLGVLVYSIYLIYDTQLVMGKFGVEYMIDDYILAALMIYIDIIQIFLYLLQIFGKK